MSLVLQGVTEKLVRKLRQFALPMPESAGINVWLVSLGEALLDTAGVLYAVSRCETLSRRISDRVKRLICAVRHALMYRASIDASFQGITRLTEAEQRSATAQQVTILPYQDQR